MATKEFLKKLAHTLDSNVRVKQLWDTGWVYDYESLDRWRANSWLFSDDYFYENREEDFACLVHNLVEVRMGAYQGDVAIFKNKSAPKLSFYMPRMSCFPWTITYENGFLRIPAFITAEELRAFYAFIMVIDMKKECFTYVPNENYSPDFIPVAPKNTWMPNHMAADIRKWLEPYRVYDGTGIKIKYTPKKPPWYKRFLK